jgi:hypothetical protein
VLRHELFRHRRKEYEPVIGGHEFYEPHDILDRLVRGAERVASVNALVRYFTDDPRHGGLFPGRRFERFAGGGDAANVRYQFTAADVLAVGLLNTKENLATMALDVLETRLDEINTLLTAIPCLAIHEVGPEILDGSSPTRQLWDVLRSCGGTNRWASSAKLLARKRPHLLPVIDKRVKHALGIDDVWRCLWTWFDDDPSRTSAVEQLRYEAGGIEDISLLRCLDAVLWLRNP